MARPLKEGLDYFPLDTRFDEKIQALESIFKNDGLVWIIKFWQLAFRTNNGEVSLEGYHGVIHAENSRVTVEKQKEIIKLCLEIGLLIKIGSEKYTSNGIKKRLECVVGERERWRIKHKIGIISPIIHIDNPEEMGESKVKESKGNKNNTCVTDFFSYFLLKTKKAFKLTPANRDLISKRFKDGFTLEQMKQAVDNFVQDDWPERQNRLDLVYCIGIRNKIDNLEKWLNYKPKEKRPEGAAGRPFG